MSFSPNSSKYDAALLGTNTEVAIAPKVRRTGVKAAKEETHPLVNGETSKIKQAMQKIKLRALPRSFFSISSETQDCVAYVSPMSYAFLAKCSFPLSNTDGLSPVIIRLFKAPQDPLSTEGQASSSDQQNSSKSNQPNGSSSTNTPTQIVLRWSRDVADKHVVFDGRSIGVADWDIWFAH